MFEKKFSLQESYIIKMAPFAKARPRVTRNATYMPRNYVARREELQALFMQEGGHLNMEGIVYLSVIFRFRMPKSWSKKKKLLMQGKDCGKKPDIDNCVGAVMDALFANDSRVVSISALKKWAYEDLIEILITVLNDDG